MNLLSSYYQNNIPGTIWWDKILNLKETIWEIRQICEDNTKMDIKEQVVKV
jgi:hypothetical protein